MNFLDKSSPKDDKSKKYAKLYFATAVLHAIYMIIFMTDKCKILIDINMALIVFYLIISFAITKVLRYNGIFISCAIAMTFFLVSHYVLLGPSFCYQYLSIGMIPFMYYLAYVNGAGIEISKKASVGSFIALLVVTIACNNIQYPLLNVSENSRRIIALLNTAVTFYISIRFMTEFVKKSYDEAGDLETKNLDLEKTANIDALTGLLNRRTIETYIKRTLHRARGEGKDFSFLMCDIDNFKHVNDTYGHDCGDQVLQNIAKLIKSELRPDDAVFRWGGEEIFIVVNGGAYIAKAVAERCRKAIEESSVMYNGTEIKVTITIGGSSYYQGATRDDLINRADKHLYEGKQNGKNQVVM